MSRKLCESLAKKHLTADDPHSEILRIINEESDPRDVPAIKENLVEWAKKRQYDRLYDEEAMEQHQNGNYDYLDNIIEEARNITEFNTDLLWLHDDYERLFAEDKDKRYTTGFEKLDQAINEGGVIRGDVFCFMAPTGVGKSIALVNTGAANCVRGELVLHVTLEMTSEKTGQRYLGPLTNQIIRDRHKNKDVITRQLRRQKVDSGGDIILAAYPPDEVSIDTLRSLLDHVKRCSGKRVSVLIIDYLELMVPRSKTDNEYERQKKVSTEICNLASKENIVIFTASQTNRSGTDVNNADSVKDKVIDLNKTAESYGKNMPLSYVVTINQTRAEYDSGKEHDAEDAPVTRARARLYIAKNRNGPKFKEIETYINYEKMKMTEGDWLTDDAREAWKKKKKEKSQK